MEDQRSQDISNQQENSDSETDEELAGKVSVGHNDMCRALFADTLRQSESKYGFECCVGESDFMGESDHSVDEINEASGVNRSGVVRQPLGALVCQEDTDDIFSGPAEWRDVWEWEVGEFNRVVEEQNTQQFDEAEICTDSDDSVDDVEYDLDADENEPRLLLHTSCGWGMANAVSSYVVVNEPPHYTLDPDRDAVCSRQINDDDDVIHSVLDDVINNCMDESAWDSADECGVTEFDKENDGDFAKFSSFQDFGGDSSDATVLSNSVALGFGSCEDEVLPEDSCNGNSFMPGYAPSIFTQRSSFGSGAYGRPVDSTWNPPRASSSADADSCRWKARMSWRKNSAGHFSTTSIQSFLANSS